MKYRAFDSYQIGFSHVKKGSGCEDYALSYTDPAERFYICVACDGHSDNNCFRSAKGAKFGCEAAVEVLSRFFELYFEEGMTTDSLSAETENRLKKSIKQCWESKVQADLRANPLTQEEMEPLTERVRTYYEAGRGLSDIYGATFIAAAMAEDCFIAIHIGDGALLCVGEEGSYYAPLPYDEKSGTGGPASLCDTDLFTRERAFRCVISKTCPQAVIVSSDGIEDCMDDLQFKELIYSLFTMFESFEEADSSGAKLNDSQQKYLDSCVRYWAAQGCGVEDDCSLAGIYTCGKEIPKVKISLGQAEALWDAAVEEHNKVLKDYERRKRGIISSIDELFVSLRRTVNTKQWIATKEKIEELKQILRTIDRNEKEKKLYYDSRLKMCGEYIKRANGEPSNNVKLIKISPIDEEYLRPDEDFIALKGGTHNNPPSGAPDEGGVPVQPQEGGCVGVPVQPQDEDSIDVPVQPQDEDGIGVPVQPQEGDRVDVPVQPQDEDGMDVPVQSRESDVVDVPRDTNVADVSVQSGDREDAITPFSSEGVLPAPFQDADKMSVMDEETEASVESLKNKKKDFWDDLSNVLKRFN